MLKHRLAYFRKCVLKKRSGHIVLLENLGERDDFEDQCVEGRIVRIKMDLKDIRLVMLAAMVMKSCIFWDITSCNPLKVSQRFGATCRFHFQGRRISRCEAGSKQSLAYSLTQKMQVTYSSKTSIEFQRTKQRFVPEDGTLFRDTG
jgi:hypothetical protein